VLTVRKNKNMFAFNRKSWELGDYSWRFISRLRQLAAASAYLSHVRPFAAKIANRTQILCENLLDLHIDNIKILKYCNILSLNIKFTRLFVTTCCRERHFATIRGCYRCDFDQSAAICEVNINIYLKNLLVHSVNSKEKLKYGSILL